MTRCELHFLQQLRCLCSPVRARRMRTDIEQDVTRLLVLQKDSGKARILESITDSRVADLFKRVDVNGARLLERMDRYVVWEGSGNKVVVLKCFYGTSHSATSLLDVPK